MVSAPRLLSYPHAAHPLQGVFSDTSIVGWSLHTGHRQQVPSLQVGPSGESRPSRSFRSKVHKQHVRHIISPSEILPSVPPHKSLNACLTYCPSSGVSGPSIVICPVHTLECSSLVNRGRARSILVFTLYRCTQRREPPFGRPRCPLFRLGLGAGFRVVDGRS